MANENVKITILENDKTKPGGAGLAPSDIAFVPGFSNNLNAPKNVPTLCNDYMEFEKLFGKTPKILTSKDVEGYEQYGFIAGSFDKSYIYAKELLFQGMPVIYSNIVDETNVDYPDVSEVKIVGSYATKFTVNTYNPDDGSCVLTAKESFTGDETIRFTTKVIVDPADGNIPTKTTLTVDAELLNDSASRATIKNIIVAVPNVDKKTSVVSLSNTQIEFTNTLDVVREFDVSIEVTLQIDLEYDEANSANNNITIAVMERPASCLDVFYEKSDCIKDQLNLVSDKSIYSVKYITSGGYPSVVSRDGKTAITPFANEMIKTAENRGDAVALIDYQRAENEKPFDIDPTSGSFYAKMQQEFNGIDNGSYGAAFYPWGEYSCGASLSNVVGLDSNDVYMPASFAYMMCVAKAIKTSPNWLAMAGVSRGIVPKLNKLCTPNNVLSNTFAEEMQPKFGVENHNLSINCVTNIRPYGLTLWGNRTMKAMNKEGAVALNFLNTRNMLSDIKKVLYSTAKSLMFEQNSDTLWLRFKAGVTPLLNQLKTGQGISDYKVVKGTTKYNGDPLQKGEMAAVIKIYPLYAVEYFELTVEINDEDVVIS